MDQRWTKKSGDRDGKSRDTYVRFDECIQFASPVDFHYGDVLSWPGEGEVLVRRHLGVHTEREEGWPTEK